MNLLSAGDVTLDIEMLATLVAGLNEDPDLFHALQFVTLAEAAVLRQQLTIVVADDGTGLDENDQREQRELIEEYMRPLLESGAAKLETVAIPIGKLPDSVAKPKHGNVTTVEATEDAVANVAIMAGRALAAERVLQQPAVNLPMQQTFYEASANVRGDHSVCDLSGHYASLAKVVEELRRSTGISPSSYEAVPLPPIGLEVFKVASSLEDLPEAVVAVRERYADLRSRLSELQRLLDDPDVPLRKKLQLKNRWVRAWKGLDTKYSFTTSDSLNFANTNNAIYKLAPDIPGAMSLNPVSWIKLLKTAAEEWPELWSHWRLRALHRTLSAYVAAPDRELGQSIAKVIRRPVTDQEIKDVREVADLMTQFQNSVAVIYAE